MSYAAAVCCQGDSVNNCALFFCVSKLCVLDFINHQVYSLPKHINDV